MRNMAMAMRLRMCSFRTFSRFTTFDMRYLTSSSSSGGGVSYTNKAMDRVNDMFAEARYALQDATDSLGTTYFSEDFEDAKKITMETTNEFNTLLDSLSPAERSKLLQANGPKMKQLEEELKILTDQVLKDH